MKPVHVKVTTEDIRDGRPNSNSRCPMALAIKEAYPDAVHVTVTREYIRWTDQADDMRYTVRQSPRGTRFVDALDQGGPSAVASFAFTLDAAQAVKAVPAQHANGSARMRAENARPRAVGTRPPRSARPAACDEGKAAHATAALSA